MTTRLAERRRVPDILECLAQLSSDEVPTPPKLANAMLDLLPHEVWRDPDYRWLDPCSKSGVFLREIARRLLFEGLVAWEPDFEKRREHIFRNMIFGCAITELTGIISRRTVYYSRHAAREHSVVKFDSDVGNIPFIRTEHSFSNGRCRICGAPEELERGVGRENYAYAFIHETYPTEEMGDMRFDVIVGNPPYQIDSDGNTRTMPIYQKFVEQAIQMEPRYLVMITPSRWMAGGLGLDDFRRAMLADRRISKLVDHPNAAEVFPGVEIKGGVSYFRWERDHDGDCEVELRRAGKESESAVRDLREFDVLVRDQRSVADSLSGLPERQLATAIHLADDPGPIFVRAVTADGREVLAAWCAPWFVVEKTTKVGQPMVRCWRLAGGTPYTLTTDVEMPRADVTTAAGAGRPTEVADLLTLADEDVVAAEAVETV